MSSTGLCKRSSKRFFWVAIVIMFVVAANYIWITGHRAARNTQCRCNLFELSCHVFTYDEAHGTLTPRVICEDGVPVHSWRVLLLETIDPQLFREYRFDEPWNSPHNLSLADRRPALYSCPAITDPDERFHTSYTAVISPRPVLRDGQAFKSIQDPENVLMIVETKRTDIHWMAPEDIAIEDVSSDTQFHEIIGGQHPDGGRAVAVTGENVPVRNLTLSEFTNRCSVPSPE